MNWMRNNVSMKCVKDWKMKCGVSINYHADVAHLPRLCLVCTIDLHAELTRHNRKKQGGLVGLSTQPAASSNAGGENIGATAEGISHNTIQPTNQHVAHDPATPSVPMETSPLIKANPSPQGTPLHTTFAGTQRFTPSTRISALNMVGDLLRKVGVRIMLLISGVYNYYDVYSWSYEC